MALTSDSGISGGISPINWMLVTETGRSSAVPSGTITRLDGSLTEASSVPEDGKADDPAKAKAKLGWTPKVNFQQLVARMVDADMKRVADGAA